METLEESCVLRTYLELRWNYEISLGSNKVLIDSLIEIFGWKVCWDFQESRLDQVVAQSLNKKLYTDYWLSSDFKEKLELLSDHQYGFRSNWLMFLAKVELIKKYNNGKWESSCGVISDLCNALIHSLLNIKHTSCRIRGFCKLPGKTLLG